MLKTSTVLPYAQRPGEKCGLGTTLRTRGDGESASVNPRVLTLRVPVCDRGSLHFSPGDAIMAPDFCLQRVLATEERSRALRSREHVRLEGEKTSQDAASTVCNCKPSK